MTSLIPQSLDTSSEIDEKMFDAYRLKPVWWRGQRMVELIEMSKQLCIEGLRQKFPLDDERTLLLKYASKKIPRELMIAAFNFDPLEHGM